MNTWARVSEHEEVMVYLGCKNGSGGLPCSAFPHKSHQLRSLGATRPHRDSPRRQRSARDCPLDAMPGKHRRVSRLQEERWRLRETRRHSCHSSSCSLQLTQHSTTAESTCTTKTMFATSALSNAGLSQFNPWLPSHRQLSVFAERKQQPWATSGVVAPTLSSKCTLGFTTPTSGVISSAKSALWFRFALRPEILLSIIAFGVNRCQFAHCGPCESSRIHVEETTGKNLCLKPKSLQLIKRVTSIWYMTCFSVRWRRRSNDVLGDHPLLNELKTDVSDIKKKGSTDRNSKHERNSASDKSSPRSLRMFNELISGN